MATQRTRTAKSGSGNGPGFERRRSRRRRLQSPSEVHLRGLGDENGWQCAGVLLNVSHEGMACRISDQKAREVCLQQKLGAIFRIGSYPTTFDLTAMISNVTPAGTEGCQVIGLEFLDDARLRAARSTLHEAIAKANVPNEETR
jgi:hypothetical protein